MKKINLIISAFTLFIALSITACDNNSQDHNESDHNDTATFQEGQGGDTSNHMNNGGNYTPDTRRDNIGGVRNDSTVGTTGSTYDANGNPVNGNEGVNSNRQQDASTGSQTNTERRKQGE